MKKNRSERPRRAARPPQKKKRHASPSAGWHNNPPQLQNRTYTRKLDPHAVNMARRKAAKKAQP